MNYKNKKLGFTFLELVIVVGIIGMVSTMIYYKGRKSKEFNAAESDKIKIVMSINNSNIDGMNENINRYISINTNMSNSTYPKGIYVYKAQSKDPITGVLSGGGFEQDTGSNYSGSRYLMPITGELPKANITFNCNEKNSIIKACPVAVYTGNAPSSELTYPTGKLVLPTVLSSKGKLSNNFVVYTFDADNYMRNRIFFSSQYSILQIYVYNYRGPTDGSAIKREINETNINTYHNDRISQFAPDSDPHWEREKYYAIPLKIEIR